MLWQEMGEREGWRVRYERGGSRQRADGIKTAENELLNTSIKKYKTWPRFYAAWAVLQAVDKVWRAAGWSVCLRWGRGKIRRRCSRRSDTHRHTLTSAASGSHSKWHQINGGPIWQNIWGALWKPLKSNHWWIWSLLSLFPFQAISAKQ